MFDFVTLCLLSVYSWIEAEIAAYSLATKTQEILPSVTFPAFSLPVFFFIFQAFTLNYFDSSAPFQASSLPFRPSSDY